MKPTFKQFLDESLRDQVMKAAADLLHTTIDKLNRVSAKDQIIDRGRSSSEKTFKSPVGNWIVRALAFGNNDYVQIIDPARLTSVYQAMDAG